MSEDLNIPKAQRRPPAPPQKKLAQAHANRNEAIVAIMRLVNISAQRLLRSLTYISQLLVKLFGQ